jgi:hypothetical protein
MTNPNASLYDRLGGVYAMGDTDSMAIVATERGGLVLASEVGDWRRFATAGRFMGAVGLVPSEYSSGGSVSRGSITKAGNGHVRDQLVEAAWAYQHRPAVGATLQRRQQRCEDPEFPAQHVSQSAGILLWISSSQMRADMSEGARQSPRGESDPPAATFGDVFANFATAPLQPWAATLKAGQRDWFPRAGTTVLGYYSKIDGSVQPYALTLPEGVNPHDGNRWPLHLVLHGRANEMNEVNFVSLPRTAASCRALGRPADSPT